MRNGPHPKLKILLSVAVGYLEELSQQFLNFRKKMSKLEILTFRKKNGHGGRGAKTLGQDSVIVDRWSLNDNSFYTLGFLFQVP